MASLTQLVVGVLLAAIVVHRICRIVYQLYFSPLRSFPGPKLWACSRLPLQITLLRGQPHLKMLELHKKYGPVVRTTPDHLTFFTGQAFRDIFLGTQFKRSPLYRDLPPNGVDHVFTTLDDVQHARQRRLLASSFTNEALKGQEPLIQHYVDKFIQRIDQESQTGPVDLTLWINATSFDAIGDLMFGESFDCLENKQLHPWISLLFGSMRATVFVHAVKQFPALHWLLANLIPKRVLQAANDHFNLSVAKADRRIAMGAKKNHDFMSALMKNGFSEDHGPHLAEQKVMSRAEIHSNAYIMIIAGSETSASAISGTMYYLCKNPSIMHKLVAEIRGALANEEDITFATTSKLTYLNAVIEEGLRMYPPFPVQTNRMPSSPEGSTVDGYFVPPGTNVGVFHYPTYRSPLNFSLPDEFHPERWLGTDKRFAHDKLDALQPFHLGPKVCLGKNLAYAEIRLIMAKLLFHFDISLHPESANWSDEQSLYFIWDKKPLMVGLKKRMV